MKPNTKLPAGATMLPKPLTLKLANWTPMAVDATIERNGIRWYRVQYGMGERGDREDWIADLPIGVSVHDYHWNGEAFGQDYGSFEKAIDGKLEEAWKWAKRDLFELEKKAATLREAIEKHCG